ncbi:MAG: glutamine amidotransferase [Tagaea sp.]|nr:glutamine amidotransferase [Tagaea sp.]
MKTLLAFRHVHFEDLGAFAPAVERLGWTLRYIDAADEPIDVAQASACDLLAVLGGPIGAYEEDRYSFLTAELAAIECRLAKDRPVLGICLGAQLIARAAGAKVFPSGFKEIGFAPIELTPTGAAGILAPFATDAVTLHWHGDTFDLPTGAALLASTRQCRNQAFTLGRNVAAFQFHPEAGGPGFERWLVGHAAELAAAGIDPRQLRNDSDRLGSKLSAKAAWVIERYLAGLA